MHRLVRVAAVAGVLIAAGCEPSPAGNAPEGETACDPVSRIEALVEAGDLDRAREEARTLVSRRRSELADALDLRVETLWRSGQGEGDSILALAREAARQRRDLPGDLERGGSLVNLATLLLVRGEYEEAKPLLEEALDVYDEIGAGSSDPSIGKRRANCLNTLGGVYHRLGDYRQARECFEKALTVRRTLDDPGRAALVSTLINLALLLTDMKEWSEARKHFAEAATLWSRKEYHNDIARASGMNNFAWLLFQLGELDHAERLFTEALEIRRRRLPSDHPHLAWTLHNLGALHLSRGEFGKAQSCLDEALRIREKAFEAPHPLLAQSLREIALLHLARGEDEQALRVAARSEEIAIEHLRLQIAGLNEQTALRFAASRYSALDVSLSAFERILASGEHPDLCLQVWEQVARSRALVLDEVSFRRHAARLQLDGDPALGKLWKEYEAASSRLAHLSLRGEGQDGHDELAEARDAKRRAEEALARRSRDFAGRAAPFSLGRALESLPDGTALVAYVRYRRFTTAPGRGPLAEPAYLAFVRAPGGSLPAAVFLGDARRIDGLVKAWREKLLAVLSLAPDAVEAQRREEAGLLRIGRELRSAVWDPVATRLAEAARVLLVCDGSLHRLALAALPRSEASAENPSYLVEDGPRLQRLSAERDLSALRDEGPPGGARAGLLAVGDVDFGEPAAGTEASPWTFRALPETAKEIQAIASLWRLHRPAEPARVLARSEASETLFRAAASQFRFLHLATHGFILDGGTAGARLRTRSIGVAPAREDDSGGRRVENPLLLAGLALAGANRSRQASGGSADGILSAEEVSALDLSGAEWVVLSACNTGVGEIQAGEGVLGLSRAFHAAGARTLILSLWPIEDRASRDWMLRLYRARWKDGLSTARCVQRACRETLAERRAAGLSTHPFFWAAFIAT